MVTRRHVSQSHGVWRSSWVRNFLSSPVMEKIKMIPKLFMRNHLLFISTINRRVHITEETLQHLNGAYQVEESDGGSRDSLLHGRKTYLVIDPHKPDLSRRPKVVRLRYVSDGDSSVHLKVNSNQTVFGRRTLWRRERTGSGRQSGCLSTCSPGGPSAHSRNLETPTPHPP